MTSDTITVAAVQFAPVADTERNLVAITELATDAAARGAELIVFPEYSSWFAPRFDADFLAAAQPLAGPFVAALRKLAARLEVHVIAGMAATGSTAARFANAVVAIDPAGTVAASYSKLHLYDAFGGSESQWVEPGELTEPETFRVGPFTVGLQTCYDLRFPEVTRRLVDAGADLVLVPAEWVAGPHKTVHWRTLLAARAIENTCFVVAADHPSPIGVGESVILDPLGVELARVPDGTGIALATLSYAAVTDTRASNPSLRLRRFGVHPL